MDRKVSAESQASRDSGSSGPVRGVWGRRPQRSPGTGLCELGLLGVQEHSADGIKRASIPRGVVQCAEPRQFPFAGQRHRIADLRSNPAGYRPPRDSGGAEVFVLRLKLKSFCRKLLLGPLVSPTIGYARLTPGEWLW